MQQSSSRVPDEDVDEEVETIVAALDEAGPEGLDRRVLGERVHCRLWGPGRYRHALAVAQQRGLVSAASRGRYVAEERTRAPRSAPPRGRFPRPPGVAPATLQPWTGTARSSASRP